ncbi:MAG: acyltransferase [Lachnospiraceae bacterium]|nr:acyltransferase [Lachnospiraceae bacterium]
MIKFIKEICKNLIYIFINYFITYIPFWPLRKLLYLICGMKIGKGSRILMGTKIDGSSKIRIGKRTIVNENCFLDGRSGLTIGDDVTVAVYSRLISGGHFIDDEDFAYHGDEIIIGNNVAIFSGCTVLAGANIEDGCVFSAMSLVRKGTYKKKGIYAGNPAKYIRDRECSLNYKQDYWHPILR